MTTLSGRVPDDLYQWFAGLAVDGAVTNSDKLRVLLAQLKRQHQGALDYASAQSWLRDLLAPLRRELSALERDEALHSELLTTLIEQITALCATLVSSHPINREAALALEETVVRRAFGLTEALLRQALTTQAAAFDPKVIRRHCTQSIELAALAK
jgi:hypothetical protein